MADSESLKARANELSARTWDLSEIENRVRKLESEGFPRKILKQDKLFERKEAILGRVQRRAEEYNLIAKNCAQGTALALMEEFGLGNMEVIKALTNFPGIGGTGEICGGITGSLIAFGLFFGSDDPLDFEKNGPTMMHAQEFMAQFEEELGSLRCANIQETIFGRNMDPGRSKENMEAFAKEMGFEKCGLPPGIGARIAAGLIIDNME
jgi:C_GCAxxG_C_C family probable redox protein